MEPANTADDRNLAALGLQIAQIGLWAWEPSTDAFDADRLTRELCGLPRTGAITRTMLTRHVHPEDFPRLDAVLRRCLLVAESAALTAECRCTHADGVARWLAFTASSMAPHGHDSAAPSKVLGTVRDITTRKQRESQLELEQRRSDESLQVRNETLATIAHDLRNALASLQSALRFAGKSASRPLPNGNLSFDLQAPADRITQLVNQLVSHLEPVEAVPATPRVATIARPQHQDASAASAPAQQPRRILVADDNADAAKTLAMLLRMEGHEVLIAHDGQEALEIAEKTRPEILLLDIAMPIKDGLAVARAIKAQQWGRDCTLIAMSGRDRAADRDGTSRAGFRSHLVKPLDFDEVNRLIMNG